MSLMYDLTAEQRGLVLKPNIPVWDFPLDYMSRLWAALAEENPDFRRAYLTRQAEQEKPE
jgi:hypothetical protein